MPGRAVQIGLPDGPSAFARKLNARSDWNAELQAKGRRAVANELNKVAAYVVQQADAQVMKHYEQRTGWRHKGGPHLLGSFSCTVDLVSTPMQVVLKSSADGNKVNALNYGSRPHIISVGTAKKRLVFPMFGSRSSPAFHRAKNNYPIRGGVPKHGRPTPRLTGKWRAEKSPFAAAQASPKGRTLGAPVVNHPGNQPTYFMEIALEQAVEMVLRKRAHLQRK